MPWIISTAAVVVSVCALTTSIYVAYIQKRKLDLDLFDRRYAYVERLREFMRYTHRRDIGPEIEANFIDHTLKADFLFPTDASRIVEAIWNLAVAYKAAAEDLGASEDATRTAARASREAIRQNLDRAFSQFMTHAERRMRFGL